MLQDSIRNNPVPVWFTLEPKSLKICGCLTQDTNATLYAIDNDWYAGYENANTKQPASVPGCGEWDLGLDCQWP